MLTSEQSIVEFKAGRAIPDRLKQSTHRHYTEYAEKMLSVYSNGLGQQRRQLHRQIESIFVDEPDCPVRRIQAFCKLLDDQSTFLTDPEGKASKLRLQVFTEASRFHPLVRQADRLFEHDENDQREHYAKCSNCKRHVVRSAQGLRIVRRKSIERREL